MRGCGLLGASCNAAITITVRLCTYRAGAWVPQRKLCCRSGAVIRIFLEVQMRDPLPRLILRTEEAWIRHASCVAGPVSLVKHDLMQEDETQAYDSMKTTCSICCCDKSENNGTRSARGYVSTMSPPDDQRA